MRKKPVTLKTRLQRSGKAISPVLSVLLMIAIAIAAALVAYAWIMGYLGGTTQKTEHAIQIQSVSSTPAPDNLLVIYVQNVGKGLVHLQQDSSVYVNDFLRTISQCPKDNPLGTGELLSLQEGETGELIMDYQYIRENYLKIRVVTTEGTFAEITIHGTRTTENPPTPPGTYNLNLNVVGSGYVTKNPNKSAYQPGESVQLIPSTSADWQFDHWSGDLTGFANPGSIVMNSHKSVTATFTQKGYNLEIFYAGSGTGTVTKNPNQATYHLGEQVQLTATPDQGSNFIGWTGDVTDTTNSQVTITIDENPQVTATFTLTQTQYSLTVTPNPSNGGTVEQNPPGPTYNQDDSVTLTATPATGFTFTGWTGDITTTTNPTTITITGNMIVTANFARTPVTLTLTASPSDAGTIVPNPTGQYYYGDTVQLTAAANGGYSFSSWGQDLAGSTNPTSITMNGNKAVTANFNQNEYTLQTSTQGSGSITKDPDQATYHYGDQVQLTANPDQDWSFTGWSGDLTGSTNPATITITGNMAVSAQFEQTQTPVTLTLHVDPQGTGSITVDSNAPYYYGNIVQLTGVPAQGYTFGGWSGDITSSENLVTITLDGDKEVTAHFNEIQPEPVLDSDFDNPQDWDAGWDDWGNPPWRMAPGEGYEGTTAARSDDWDEGPFTCDHLDASQANTIRITFKYRVSGTEAGDLQVLYSGMQNPDSGPDSPHFTLLPNGNIGIPGSVPGATPLGGGWYEVTITITRASAPSAFTAYFRFRFESSLSSFGGGESVWVDDVTITMEP